MTDRDEIRIRPARAGDIAALLPLQLRAVRELGARYYTERQLESYLAAYGTLDRQLIRDGTYYVAELRGRLVGCGGWSARDRALGSDARQPGCGARRRPGRDSAVMRAFYVDPEFARRGIARRLMAVAESAAAAAGFDRAELLATLTGRPLYLKLGYRALADEIVHCPEGVTLRGVRMEKSLAAQGRNAA